MATTVYERRSWGFVGWTYKLTVPKAIVKSKWNTDEGRAWKLWGKITGVAYKSRYYYNYIVIIIHDYQYHIIILLSISLALLLLFLSLLLPIWKSGRILLFFLFH